MLRLPHLADRIIKLDYGQMDAGHGKGVNGSRAPFPKAVDTEPPVTTSPTDAAARLAIDAK